jgi:hypothetical protein
MEAKKYLFGAIIVTPFLIAALLGAAVYVFEVDRTVDPPLYLPLILIPIIMIGWIAFIRDVWKNPLMPRDKRWLWTVVLVSAHWKAMPFYWWFYIRAASGSPRAEPAS